MGVLHCPSCNTAVHDVDERPEHVDVTCDGCGHILRSARPLPVAARPAVNPVAVTHPPARTPWALGVLLGAAFASGVFGVLWAVGGSAPPEAAAPTTPTATTPTTPATKRDPSPVRGSPPVEAPAPASPLADRSLDQVVRLVRTGATAGDRLRAAEELTRRKGKAKPAVAELVDALAGEQDPQVADAIADVVDGLGVPEFGGEAVLERAVGSESRRLRLYALRHYATRPAAGDALTAVVKWCRGDPVGRDAELRTAAVVALGRAGPVAARQAAGFDVLLEAADDRNAALAAAAATVFEQFASAKAFGKADLPYLRAAAKNNDRRVARSAVVAALGQTTTAADAFAVCPLTLLTADDGGFLAAVIPALARWPRADWPAGYWEAVLAQSAHPDKAVRLAVLRAIHDLKIPTGVAKRVVRLADTDADADVRILAAVTLAGLTVPPGEMSEGEVVQALERSRLPEKLRPKPPPVKPPVELQPVYIPGRRYTVSPPPGKTLYLGDSEQLTIELNTKSNAEQRYKYVVQLAQADGITEPLEVELVTTEPGYSKVRYQKKERYVETKWLTAPAPK